MHSFMSMPGSFGSLIVQGYEITMQDLVPEEEKVCCRTVPTDARELRTARSHQERSLNGLIDRFDIRY